jgi:hypothetical protein
MQVGFGNLGGVLSAYTYTWKDAPSYHRGHAILIGLLGLSTCLCVFMRWWCKRENRRRDDRDMVGGRKKVWGKKEMFAESERGDGAGFFRYTL